MKNLEDIINNKQTEQEIFETYISHTTLINQPNLYGNYIEQVFFTNSRSLYLLKNYFLITKQIERLKYAGCSNRALLASYKQIVELMIQANNALGDKQYYVKDSDIQMSDKIVNISTRENTISFLRKEIDYMNALIGRPNKLLISKENPLLYAESEKGKAYIFGTKKI